MPILYGRAAFEYQDVAADRLEHGFAISEWQHKAYGNTLYNSISYSSGACVHLGCVSVHPLLVRQDKAALPPPETFPYDIGKWLVRVRAVTGQRLFQRPASQQAKRENHPFPKSVLPFG